MADRKDNPGPNRPDQGDEMLDALFAQARSGAPAVPEALQARILADAALVQAETSAIAVDRAAPEPDGLLARIGAALGGWPALGGMVAASVLGIWIGAAPPAFLPDATQYLEQTAQDVDVFDSYEYAVAWAEDGQ